MQALSTDEALTWLQQRGGGWTESRLDGPVVITAYIQNLSRAAMTSDPSTPASVETALTAAINALRDVLDA